MVFGNSTGGVDRHLSRLYAGPHRQFSGLFGAVDSEFFSIVVGVFFGPDGPVLGGATSID